MSASDNRFSLTRAASRAGGAAETTFLSLVRFLKVPVLLLGVATGNSFALHAASDNLPSSRLVKNNDDGSQTLLGYVPHDLSSLTFFYHALPAETLDLRVILPLRPGVDDLIQQLYDPQSPLYQHFLTPEQFTERFGPSTATSEAVKQFLTSQGLSVNGQSSNGTILRVSGPVPAVEAAFKVHINHYLEPDGTDVFAPDTDPSIPGQLAGRISGIAGLDSLPRFVHHSHTVLHQKMDGPPQLGTGPNGGLSPSDIAKAYNLSTIPSTGAGQVVAIFALDGFIWMQRARAGLCRKSLSPRGKVRATDIAVPNPARKPKSCHPGKTPRTIPRRAD